MCDAVFILLIRCKPNKKTGVKQGILYTLNIIPNLKSSKMFQSNSLQFQLKEIQKTPDGGDNRKFNCCILDAFVNFLFSSSSDFLIKKKPNLSIFSRRI